MTNLESVLKSRDITLQTKVCLVKAMAFPLVIYGCESWTMKKTEHRRIDSFELWCWRRLLRIPWTTRRSNQCILKEISPEYSLEGLMLKLKLQYFGYLMQSIGILAAASILPMNIQDWFPLGCTGWISLKSKGFSRIFFNTTVQKHQFFSIQLSL